MSMLDMVNKLMDIYLVHHRIDNTDDLDELYLHCLKLVKDNNFSN